ncbi:hypothetical protein UVI_02001040 [Ustilaginoidea virens]|nr:hypothetical protein UVI_02001040 [Ustilaginoidea virens]
MPVPMSRADTSLPGQERSVSVAVRSLRSPPLDMTLASQPVSTSVLDIKTQVSRRTGIPVGKIKVLHDKRPLADSKILADVLAPADRKLELSVMVMGGAAALPGVAASAAPGGPASGEDALTTDAFWADLGGFLTQRLRDERAATDLARLFKASWEASRANGGLP